MRLTIVLAGLLAGWLAGCSDGNGSGQGNDGGQEDTGLDAGGDPGADSGSDPGGDTGTDAGADPGADPGDPASDQDIEGDNPPESDVPEDDLTGGDPPAVGSCLEQGLDEMCRRRDLGLVKPFEEVINPDGWSQPETLIFQDKNTGVEIVRLTDDPEGSMHHCHINRSPFNSDGSWVKFGSRRCWPDQWCPDNYFYIASPLGKGPRLIDVPGQGIWMGPYGGWNPDDPNMFYFVNHGENNGLYRVRVDDGAFNTGLIMELPNPDKRKHIFANITPDGTVVIKDTNADGQQVNVYAWNPADPENLITFDLQLGVEHPDHSASEEWHLHDFTMRRNPDNTSIFNYGPQGSVGEPFFVQLRADGSQEYNIAFARLEDSHCPVPYYSHPAFNHDGTMVAYAGVPEKFIDGTHPDGSPYYTWNDSHWGAFVHALDPFDPSQVYATSTLVAEIAPLSLRPSHFAWDGYDDRWVHAAQSSVHEGNKPLYRMASDGSLTEVMVDTYMRTTCTDNCSYCSLPRPAQSPDATKVLYTSDMLQHGENIQDIYMALHRWPFAPVWLGLDNSDELRLRWRFHENLARESRGVRVFRSADFSPPVFEAISGVVEADSFLDDNASLSDGEAALYAVTGVELSRTESRSLSRIIRVTRVGDRYRADLVEPYGSKGFDTTAPAVPADLAVNAEGSDRARLSWTQSPYPDVRGYHVYASPGQAPEINQAYRIATLPVEHPRFLDWSCGQASGTHYAVTAVDFQGNESEAARLQVP